MPIHAFFKDIQQIIDHAHERGIAARFQSQVSGAVQNNIGVSARGHARPTGQITMTVVYRVINRVPPFLKRLFDLAFSFLIVTSAPAAGGS